MTPLQHNVIDAAKAVAREHRGRPKGLLRTPKAVQALVIATNAMVADEAHRIEQTRQRAGRVVA
jgi:hypothetical protein